MTLSKILCDPPSGEIEIKTKVNKWDLIKCKKNYIAKETISSVQFSRVQPFVTPWIAAPQASLTITNSWSSLKLTSIESVMPSHQLILCHPLLLPSILPSIRVFSNESVLHIRWPKYWSFSFSIIPSNEYSGLIPFRMDWFDLFAIQVTLKSLLQHHSSEASVLCTQVSLWSISHIHTFFHSYYIVLCDYAVIIPL